MIHKTSIAIDKWTSKDKVDRVTGVMDFKRFSTFVEVKNMDLVDQKALWNKLSEKYFSILLKQGSFGLKNLFTIRLIYRFYMLKERICLKLGLLLNDISCKKSLNKKYPIIEVIDRRKTLKKLGL